MKSYAGNYFTLSMPNTWQAEFDQDEGFDVVYKADGVGEIQISALIHEKELTPDDLKQIAADDLQAGARLQELDLGDFHGFWFDYDYSGDYWCEWYLCSGQLMLFVTYHCPINVEGAENSDVDLIIGTLTPSENGYIAQPGSGN